MDTRAKDFSTGFKVETLDKNLLKTFSGNSVADALSAGSGVNIKSYGPGGLSSISIRGGGSYHTAILWNGINLQSPMNGGLNLSSIPMDLIGDISLQYGGSGSLAGSGAAFGVLRLSSSSGLRKENTAFLSSSVGSYSNYRLALGSNFYIKNSLFSIKGFYQSSENDFEFVNTAKFGSPTEKQSNSAYSQYGIIVDNKTTVGENTTFLASLFFNNYDKDIQTLMSDYTPSEANQVDNNLLVTAIFKYSKNRLNINFKNAYIGAKLHFTDPMSPDPESKSASSSFISELESNYFTSENQNLYTAINYTYENADSGGYSSNPSRNRLSFIAAYKFSHLWDKVNIALSLRQELIDSNFNPLQYSIGVDGNIVSFLDFNFNFGKVYRIPTMNDLYWRETGFAVGNPDLIDESGYSSDFGLTQTIGGDFIDIKFGQSIFYNYINNLIIWAQLDNGKWKPLNKNIGKSKGLELSVDFSSRIFGSKIGIKESYTYTDASTSDDEGGSWQKQVYTPTHNSNTNLWWEYKNLRSDFSLNYYSDRNIDNAGNTLEGYSIGDFSVSYFFDLKKINIQITAKANNLWNTQYQVTSGYAMPLRNYMLTARFSI
ncbi:MAG: TonB-dependent receptor [Flavobacteriales bacterium]|nr:TonB-dependent receptor [Flavobacteriales bacterium]